MPVIDLTAGFLACLPDPGQPLAGHQALAQKILAAPLAGGVLAKGALEMVADCDDDRALRIVAHATTHDALRRACVARVGVLVAEGRDSNRWGRRNPLPARREQR